MGGMRTTGLDNSENSRGETAFHEEEINPDCIVTSCSSCYMQFDQSQSMLREEQID